MRQVFAGRPVEERGRELRIPCDRPGAAGLAPAVVLTEPNPQLPILIGASIHPR